jgi:hypothetical protein
MSEGIEPFDLAKTMLCGAKSEASEPASVFLVLLPKENASACLGLFLL